MTYCKGCGEEIPKDWTRAFRIQQEKVMSFHLICIPKRVPELDQRPNKIQRLFKSLKRYLFIY
jgi:hypothetical protein